MICKKKSILGSLALIGGYEYLKSKIINSDSSNDACNRKKNPISSRVYRFLNLKNCKNDNSSDDFSLEISDMEEFSEL